MGRIEEGSDFDPAVAHERNAGMSDSVGTSDRIPGENDNQTEEN